MDTSSEDVMFQMESDMARSMEPDENEEKVDVMMSVLLKWLSSMVDLEADQLPLLEDVFKLLVGCFDRLLLTTNQTKYAQWALFYVCSMKEDFTMRLFEHLFDIVQNPKFPPQQRQRACMYIASLSSRATYVKETTTQQVLEYMCSWMTKYIELQGDLGKPDLSTHMLFYAMFHGVCYILRNVHESIFDVVSAKHTIQALGIVVIARCSLNPLKICAPALVSSFIEVMAKYGVSFTNVLQQNERLVIPTKDVWGPSSVLTDFFPFDPYLLRRSSAFLLPFYHYTERYQKFSKGDALESGYATEGETEMDMDLRGHHGGVDQPEGDMDGEDAHTTESMMAMMDFGRGSMPLQLTNHHSNAMQSSSGSVQQNGLFGSFDEKSSLSSGGHGSNGFQQANGSFSSNQPTFGNPFGGPLISPATATSSLSGFGSFGNGFVSQSPLRGPSPATDPGSFSLVGSLEPRRNTQAKRNRDENWMPSTPLSVAAFQPTGRPSPSPLPSTSPAASSSHAWGTPLVSSSTSNPADH
jgi:hypothetical protein